MPNRWGRGISQRSLASNKPLGSGVFTPLRTSEEVIFSLLTGGRNLGKGTPRIANHLEQPSLRRNGWGGVGGWVGGWGVE